MLNSVISEACFKQQQIKSNLAGNLHLWELLTQLQLSTVSGTLDPEAQLHTNVSINWAAKDERARKVVRRSNYRMTGKFPSHKNKRSIQWESSIELKAMRLLEVFSNVRVFSEQPAEIWYRDNSGNLKRHYPDLLANMDCGANLLLEIKPDRYLEDEDLISRTNLLTTALKRLGYVYFVVSENQLGGVQQENARRIIRQASIHVDLVVQERIRNEFVSRGTMRLFELKQALETAHKNPAGAIFCLMRDGVIGYDMNAEIGSNSMLRWAKGR